MFLTSAKSVIFPFTLGLLLGINLTVNYESLIKKSNGREESLIGTWNNKLANQLFDEVKILCWIMTSPENHHKKAVHVMRTWGKRCNKLLFMSSKVDPEINSIALPVSEGRNQLWDKTKAAFRYVYRNHPEYDFFLKADDDSYVVMENLRLLLSQYRPETALYFGHRYSMAYKPYSYMAGGVYVLSRKAVEKLVVELLANCRIQPGGSEDLEMGRCLADFAIHVDVRDEFKRKRIFPIGVQEHLKKSYNINFWYYKNSYYSSSRGSDCCSDTLIGLHYVDPGHFYTLEYLLYRATAFGIYKNSPNELPRKLTLQEIIDASDAAPQPRHIKNVNSTHNLTDSERYR